MNDTLDNKCPTCSAMIVFNPATQTWDCTYCGSKFTLEQMKEHNNASNVEANTVNTSNNELDMYACKNCGAEIVADKTTTATFCVYCGSTAILKERIDDGVFPNYIIPFKNVKEDAIKAFEKLTKWKPLAPRDFKGRKLVEKITGVYIPFWAYDLEAAGPVEFRCTDTKTYSDSKYEYKEVSTYRAKRSGRFDFNKVLADASTRFSDDLMDSLEPFDYSDLTSYNHAYLSGFLAEKYDVSIEEGLARASERTNNTAVALLESTVHHDSVRVYNSQMTVSKKADYYIMLPVWMVNIKYKDKNYIFAMNGQTGKMIGNIPIGVKEAILWAVGIFALLFVLAFIVLKVL